MTPSDLPPAAFANLVASCEGDALATLSGNVADNAELDPGDSLTVAANTTVAGNTIGDASSVVILGDGASVEGNIEGVGAIIVAGNVYIDPAWNPRAASVT